MRIVESPQIMLGTVDIAKIVIDPKNRDTVSKILKGLQFIHNNTAVRLEIFSLLEEHINPKVSKKNGRPGMEMWRILVMGMLRLTLNIDYDFLHDLVNNHTTIRKMLGHSSILEETTYNLQTIKDNVHLLTPELLDKINQVIVKAGHTLVKKKDDVLNVRCDSFVVETNVHFPTDISLLWDAMRKVITLTARVSLEHGLTDFRQNKYNLKEVKKSIRAAQLTKRGTSNTKNKNQDKAANSNIATPNVISTSKVASLQKKMEDAYLSCLDTAKKYLGKAKATISTLEKECNLSDGDVFTLVEIQHFIDHAERQIDQTDRRVLQYETIPQDQKVFSIFKSFTEWISKGKAGVPVELGLKVCIVEDQHQFILHHNVMQKQTDDKIAVSIIQETKNRFADIIYSCSFDKGFHAPVNQEALAKEVALVVLPRKGKLSQQAKAIENTEEFKKSRRKHSAVESGINALEVHGLDFCPDYGIDGFKRYCSLAIVAQNVQRIGIILIKREREAEKKAKKKRLSCRHWHENLEKMAA